ncbi:hypothetical protein MMC11_006831 [Xylographa trunciseda]|nr:hypothetical protein [Xylographa trunciseda]
MLSLDWVFILCCLLFTSPQATASRPSYVERNLHTIQSIYNLTVYPNNVPIIQHGASAVPAGLFNQQATGRITPVGTFTGFVESVEYFFGLAPLPGPPTNVSISKAEIVEFNSGCPNVASSVVYLVCSAYSPGQPDDGKFIATLKQVANWHFDDDGLVLKYDAWIPNLSNWTVIGLAADLSILAVQDVYINTICNEAQLRCVGANTQYSSVAQCISVLSAKPFGTFDEAWGDDVVCRSIHLILTLIDPDVHCPHVGPTGGGKCSPIDYNDAYFNDTALFGGPLLEFFMCPREEKHHY